jgi:hypothetical protein
MGSDQSKPKFPYHYPIHPTDMVQQSSPDMDKVARMLRLEMMKTIDTLSQKYSQQVLDKKVMIDVEEGQICGMDTTCLSGSGNLCLGTPMPLGQMTAQHWITMQCK